MSRFLLFFALLLLLPAATSASVPGSTQSQALSKIEATTEHLRALKHTQSVRAKFPGDTAFNAVLTNQLHRDNPDREIDLSQHEMVLLGLLNKNQSLRKIAYGEMQNEIIGLYDYKAKTLYVRTHGNKAFGVDRYVIAHEYTHALQDQHWNLKKLLPDQTALTYRNSDLVSARHALTEGDAVNSQNLYISRQYTAREIQALYNEANSQPQSKLPRAIERQFYFPYTTGYSFVKTIYGRGGMAAVNAVYRRPPASTYEIMHPSAYLQHWKPTAVSLHGVKGFDDWKQTDDDVMGAFGYEVLIWQYSSEKAAKRAVNGYKGDRYVFLQNGDRDAILMKSVWTSNKSAAAARTALAASIKKRFPGGRWTQQGTLFTYASGAVGLKATGKRLTLTFGPSADVTIRLASAETS